MEIIQRDEINKYEEELQTKTMMRGIHTTILRSADRVNPQLLETYLLTRIAGFGKK